MLNLSLQHVLLDIEIHFAVFFWQSWKACVMKVETRNHVKISNVRVV